MTQDLYGTDALAWSEQQAELLQRLSQGERVNAAIDWPNIVDEVRDVGLSELRAVRSLFSRAIEHLMKLHGWPDARETEHWRDEALTFLLDAGARFAPSMRARLDIGTIYRQARLAHRARRVGGAEAAAMPPAQCPYTLDDLLVPDDTVPDIDRLVARLTTDGRPTDH